MELSYQLIKKTLYISMTVLGVILIIGSSVLTQMCSEVTEPVSFVIAAGILFLVGLLCLFFGFETYLLRDDPDVWR